MTSAELEQLKIDFADVTHKMVKVQRELVELIGLEVRFRRCGACETEFEWSGTVLKVDPKGRVLVKPDTVPEEPWPLPLSIHDIAIGETKR
jgi:hypothetical protein